MMLISIVHLNYSSMGLRKRYLLRKILITRSDYVLIIMVGGYAPVIQNMVEDFLPLTGFRFNLYAWQFRLHLNSLITVALEIMIFYCGSNPKPKSWGNSTYRPDREDGCE